MALAAAVLFAPAAVATATETKTRLLSVFMISCAPAPAYRARLRAEGMVEAWVVPLDRGHVAARYLAPGGHWTLLIITAGGAACAVAGGMSWAGDPLPGPPL